MKKVYRRVMLFTSVIVFLLAAPLVVLYGIGYRTQFTTVDPLPVGVILVDSVPRRAEVFLNDELVGRTPEALTNLPDGQAQVRLELAGYKTWQKNIQVQPGKALEFRDIRLFPAEIITENLLANVKQFSLSPNRKLIAAVTSDFLLHVIDESGDEVVQATKLAALPESLLWAPTNNQILLQTGKTNSLFTVDRTGTLRRLPELVATDIVWDPRVPDRLLYIDIQKKLSALNIAGGNQVLVNDLVKKFVTSSRSIYILNSKNDIAVYTLQGDLINSDITVPSGDIADIFVTPAGDIAYQMEDTSVWALNENDEPVLVSDSALTVQWSTDGMMLLIQTDDNSLHVYNAADERSSLSVYSSQLITRLKRAIKNPQWFAGSRHILYEVDDEILVSEIDTRDHSITAQLDTTNTGTSLATVGTEGELILYLKKEGTSTNLVTTSLVVN